ncbi:hypothetical protein J0B02_06475 [Enterobacteriaceae bacterium YMB-R22]|uniref:hypothetical protein n=1 Tax=Tenebrionicola larvae TaxID=2815733 RepID=UPI0020121AE4|nr:hypothetical protein [Tenebrionicola larvae]MBV4412469.1 hypothetical protein [Tenebrionicola larvae]
MNIDYLCAPVRLRQAGIVSPAHEMFESVPVAGRRAREVLGQDRYEACEYVDLVRRFNQQMMEEMAAGEDGAKARAAALRRTADRLTKNVAKDRAHLNQAQLHGWQGTQEGKHSGNMAVEPQAQADNESARFQQ